MPRTEQDSSASAKVLYRPVGLVSSVVACTRERTSRSTPSGVSSSASVWARR